MEARREAGTDVWSRFYVNGLGYNSDLMDATIRRAVLADAPRLQRLINDYAGKGQMLPRSRQALYEHVRDYLVAVADGIVVGCVALHVSWEDLAEIRSLAVAEQSQGSGIGVALVRAALEDAQELGVRTVFALTFVEGFFLSLGFRPVDKSELPHKIWQECVHCIHFPDCDEVALTLDLTA
ncbi:MAG: N-acetyltransferase [Actinobacteria bacterium]|nr:N-acetyltransferase [Actinomycetota bacterium]